MSAGKGERLSRFRMVQSAQGRKIEGRVERRSFTGVMQSISQTGHFMLFGYECSGIDSFSNG